MKTFVILVLSVLSAPGVPTAFTHSVIGPMVNLTWSRPQQENGIIRSYNRFYSHNEDKESVHTQTFGPNTFSYSVDVLGGVTYRFYVRAVTIKPGTNASLTVAIPEYCKPSYFFLINGKVITQ